MSDVCWVPTVCPSMKCLVYFFSVSLKCGVWCVMCCAEEKNLLFGQASVASPSLAGQDFTKTHRDKNGSRTREHI